jgi:TPR repeat protein
MLGSILVNNEYEMENSFVKGVDYLEKASNENVSDAMFNLYALYRKGLYSKKKAIYWLDYSASIGYERAVIFSAYEKYLSAIEKGSRDQVKKIVDGLINYKFKGSSGERDFFISTMYSDEKSPIFNDKLRLKYLKLSADAGYERAIVILNEYNRLKELEGK